MKFSISIIATLAILSSASAFVPASTHQGTQIKTTALSAQMDRKAFLASAVGTASTIFVASPLIANAGTMGQERVSDPTEV